MIREVTRQIIESLMSEEMERVLKILDEYFIPHREWAFRGWADPPYRPSEQLFPRVTARREAGAYGELYEYDPGAPVVGSWVKVYEDSQVFQDDPPVSCYRTVYVPRWNYEDALSILGAAGIEHLKRVKEFPPEEEEKKKIRDWIMKELPYASLNKLCDILEILSWK